MIQSINLKAEDILNKQINVDFKGYNAVQVDEFHDLVLQDYQIYEEKMKEVTEMLQKYETMIEDLKRQVELASQNEPVVMTSSISNVDILKRLSRLEAEVFKNK